MKTKFIAPWIGLLLTSQVTVSQTARELGNACFSGNIDEVRRLIKAGVDVNEEFYILGTNDVTALQWACMWSIGKQADQVEIVKALIDAGADVNAKRGRAYPFCTTQSNMPDTKLYLSH